MRQWQCSQIPLQYAYKYRYDDYTSLNINSWKIHDVAIVLGMPCSSTVVSVAGNQVGRNRTVPPASSLWVE